MHGDLAPFEPWADAQMGICGIERVGKRWGEGREETRGQWNKNELNYLRRNIILGYTHSKPPEKMLYFQ